MLFTEIVFYIFNFFFLAIRLFFVTVKDSNWTFMDLKFITHAK
jgi:hypothetical protein